MDLGDLEIGAQVSEDTTRGRICTGSKSQGLCIQALM